ncbi:P-loop containing nucleoside triphosphate hydrolase protein [Mycena haematopus]|nr:P-loop containing nucleoside triphosphate hydrolase protein [Mycena haematopus]
MALKGNIAPEVFDSESKTPRVGVAYSLGPCPTTSNLKALRELELQGQKRRKLIVNRLMGHYGLPAFRPAWGSLNELALRLPKGTPIQALSGTLPPHIKTTVIDHLNFDPAVFLSLKLSSNRPNIIYCTHRIVGLLTDFRNLDFLVSIPFTRLVKVVIYHDDTQQSSDAANYTDNRLPPHLRTTGIVQHYHNGMSTEYLKQVFDDFSNPNGVCKILHATEGLSTGLHVDDIDAVIDYGLPQHKTTAQQRAGRSGRRGQPAVYLAMAEPWAYTMSLDAVDPNNKDPDQPISGRLLKNAKKRERAGLANQVGLSNLLETLDLYHTAQRIEAGCQIPLEWG